MSALVLHAAVLLLRVESPRSLLPPAQPARDPLFISLDAAPVAPAASPAPGGGAETNSDVEARSVVRTATRPAPRPVLTEAERPTIAEPELDPLPRLKPARALLVAARTSQAEGGGRQQSSRDLGTGPGSGSGPGGDGRGSGRLVKSGFAFGGRSGAFRAEVCFIPEPVRSLKEIRRCEPVATFFTDALNVPPRSFTEGFPGITDRTEWFRIEYRGKFRVRKADYFKFRLLSDDGAILYVDGHRIIDNDGQHLPFSKTMTITLEAGEHELFVSYYQGPRDNLALQLFVTPYGQPERLFGPEL